MTASDPNPFTVGELDAIVQARTIEQIVVREREGRQERASAVFDRCGSFCSQCGCCIGCYPYCCEGGCY